ncbi:MAG: TIGR04076 family protein [Candidatus Bathyarchaeota archaeon]|nr:TIGR04076 family protein [Candidatus Bathyarchaeota archaeon]
MLEKIKITVIKKYKPEDVLGHEVKQSTTGKRIPSCLFFEEGQEFIAEHSFKMPDGFCGWAWRDLTVRFTKFDLVDEDWPEPGVTYVACGDGLRPVIFQLEKLE